MMVLQQCTDNKAAFNQIVSIEQSITVADALQQSPLIQCEGKKINVIKQIIRIIEFYLEVTGNKKLESYQVQVIAGDLYDRFRTDTVDDIILLFKMMRTGELGKIGYAESFNEKLSAHIELYLLHKSEEREKLINRQKRMLRKRNTATESMTPEAQAKFEELQKRLKVKESISKETFSISKALQSIDGYLETLPETSTKLSDSDLKFELLRTKTAHPEAYEILSLEEERRKQIKKAKR